MVLIFAPLALVLKARDLANVQVQPPEQQSS
jgi:hypothetical protein